MSDDNTNEYQTGIRCAFILHTPKNHCPLHFPGLELPISCGKCQILKDTANPEADIF